jgi:hypothetical protein
MMSQAELGLAEVDDSIDEADRNIRQIESLLPELELSGVASSDVEYRLQLLLQALHHLRAQRRAIVETLDGVETLPRIVRRPN